MFKFNAVIPKHSFQDVVHWHGFNSVGTHVFGTKFYKHYHAVKVYRAGIMGSIHEIADIHFAGYPAKPLFYSKTHELVWLFEVDYAYIREVCRDFSAPVAEIDSEGWFSLVMCNVNTGQLKRYYAKIREAALAGYEPLVGYEPRLIPAEDDALVLVQATSIPNSNIITAQLFKISLNQADETFSPQFLAALPMSMLVRPLDFVYTRGRLIAKGDAPYYNHLFLYDFATQQWSAEEVEFDGKKPIYFDEDRLSFDGHHLIYVTAIGIFQLNVQEHRWKKVIVFTSYRVPDLEFDSCVSTLVSHNLQTLCTLVQDLITITDNVEVLITVYHDKDYLPCLKNMCIQLLLSYFAKFRPKMSDHDVCKLLSLETIAHKYFGRLFL